nr:hypothetical protein [Actinomycetota bacterium]
ALVPVVGTGLVIAAGMTERASEGGLLALAPMQLLGRYSYSVYLWHWPVLVLVAARHPDVLADWPRALTVMLVAGLPAAVLSYHLVENPFRRSFTRRPDRKVLLAGAGILVGGAVFLAAYGPVAMGPLSSEKRAAAPAAGLKPTSFVPANLRPTLLAAHNGGNEAGRSCTRSLNPCFLGDPSATTTIALYGDSHSLHLFGAFDAAGRANHWKVIALVRPGCPSYEHPAAVKFLSCAGFRTSALGFIRQADPDLVVLSNSSTIALDQLGARMSYGVRRAVQSLPADVPVVVFGQTPTAARDVPACLSDHLHRTRACEPKPGSGRVAAVNRQLRAALARTRANFVDVRRLVCERRCPAVIGNVLVYRDDDHVTYDFARTRGPVLADILRPWIRNGA